MLLYCSQVSHAGIFSCTAPLSRVDLRVSGTIEDDGDGCLQADFANMYIGGGVLNHGAVQEEIRFLINTGRIAGKSAGGGKGARTPGYYGTLTPNFWRFSELLVSRLLCEVMADNETISIIGSVFC